jgi:hypothetical protein
MVMQTSRGEKHRESIAVQGKRTEGGGLNRYRGSSLQESELAYAAYLPGRPLDVQIGSSRTITLVLTTSLARRESSDITRSKAHSQAEDKSYAVAQKL